METTFQRFPNFPTEVRLLIWEEALLEARGTRTVTILDKDRVVPMKHLISSLLSVDKESRVCAQAFYNTKLDVYTVPSHSGREFKNMSNVMCSVFALGLLREAGPRLFGQAEEAGSKAGSIYISPEQDMLIVKQFGALIPSGKELGIFLNCSHPFGRYISARVPAAAS
ncbi:hypothetical protein VP1G_07963 [Cytospora mali]|uniref:2EXR domain-containing protein n=1 Tax=Cytospora mali TaxID=578113 RepID=A0A194VA51_CYTMA|nr:hypothetical protein VP1G_07963 [Valsa mali var. pyri (nom. inval.)]